MFDRSDGWPQVTCPAPHCHYSGLDTFNCQESPATLNGCSQVLVLSRWRVWSIVSEIITTNTDHWPDSTSSADTSPWPGHMRTEMREVLLMVWGMLSWDCLPPFFTSLETPVETPEPGARPETAVSWAEYECDLDYLCSQLWLCNELYTPHLILPTSPLMLPPITTSCPMHELLLLAHIRQRWLESCCCVWTRHERVITATPSTSHTHRDSADTAATIKTIWSSWKISDMLFRCIFSEQDTDQPWC